MKFLIIGTGFIFPIHVEAIRDVGGKIREVVNTTQGQDAWRHTIANSDADCVVVLTPNDLHFPIIETAVKYGKKVLCEKPVVISTRQAEALLDVPNVYSVMQLRHHPLVPELLKERENKFSEITMDISVYRDEAYYQGWKGQKERSGGVLFNLGVHYFDMIQYVFGASKEISLAYCSDKTVEGRIRGKGYACNFRVSTDEPRATQRRIFTVNGKPYNFSSQDNLSFENLHKFVYQDLINGRGLSIAECYPAIELIESIYAKEISYASL